jgi:hypothetical protein
MEPAARSDFAKTLGVTFDDWREDAAICLLDADITVGAKRIPAKLRAEAEACVILNLDRKGIQARSHSAARTLNPFAENHTWLQVLESVVAEIEIPVPVSSPGEFDLEAAVLEYVGEQIWNELDAEEQQEIESFLEQGAGFVEQLQKAGYGPFGLRLVGKGVFGAAKSAGFGAFINAVKAAAYLNKTFGLKIQMKNAAKLLSSTLKGVNALLWASLVIDVANLIFGSSRQRLLLPIAQLHMEYLAMSIE